MRRARSAGTGTTWFVTGELGSGKQTLVEELERRAREDPELGGAFFARAACSREAGASSPYEPFAWLLLDLVEQDRAAKRWNAIFGAVREVAPDWLGMVPIAGPAIQAGVKTALAAHEIYAGEAAEEQARRAQNRHLQFLSAVESRLERAPLVVLVVAQAEWIDGASASLLDRVARLAGTRPVVVVVTYRPADVGEGHPLRGVERGLRIDGLAASVPLGGLGAAAIEELASSARGMPLAPDVAAWLAAYTDGNPFFVTELLPVLERRGVLVEADGHLAFRPGADMAGSDIPGAVADVLDERIERLDAALRNLLAIAAVEGPEFLTTTLASVAHAEEDELLSRLSEAEERHRIVHYAEALQRQLFRYRFAHLLLHQRLYERLSVPQRVMYHGRIADALVELWGEEAPRPSLVTIARHYELGRDAPAAARFLLRAAGSAQLDGASREAAGLARRALGLIGDREHALRAELIALLVGAEWENVHAGDTEIAALIGEGRAAAERAGDPALRGRLRYAEARYVLATRDADAGVAALAEAREAARAAGDPLLELAVSVELGNAQAIRSVDAGLATLEEALALYDARLAPLAEGNSELGRLHGRLVAFLGVGEFDRGDLGRARRLLDASVAGLDAIARPDDLPRILNYRAQTALAMGDGEQAEADLRRALSLEPAGAGPWTSYNTALLGKVLIDAERFEEAREPIDAAWQQARAAWQVRLGTNVRMYRIELLLRPGALEGDLDEAARLVEDQLAESRSAGLANMLAAASSLAAELALRRGDAEAALASSAEAVALIEIAGSMSIVRTDEVLWRHARCLAAVGRDDEAEAALERARVVVTRKADSVGDDPAARERALHANAAGRALFP